MWYRVYRNPTGCDINDLRAFATAGHAHMRVFCRQWRVSIFRSSNVLPHFKDELCFLTGVCVICVWCVCVWCIWLTGNMHLNTASSRRTLPVTNGHTKTSQDAWTDAGAGRRDGTCRQDRDASLLWQVQWLNDCCVA